MTPKLGHPQNKYGLKNEEDLELRNFGHCPKLR